MKKVLVGTVGYHNLGNHSIGPALLPQLQKMNWPSGVELDELNWGPIAIVQKFQSISSPYDRIILLSAIERPGRQTGDISLFHWRGKLPDAELIQRCVGDAVTGVISVENLLIIGEYFKIWPEETFLLDVDPGPEQAGEEFTEEFQQAIPDVIVMLQQLASAGTMEYSSFNPLYGDTLIGVDV